jgi:deazaflavin-dependent oxidoreductase (nitroreductase family)
MLRIGWAIDKTVSRVSSGRFALPNASDGTLRTLFLHTVGRASGRSRRNGIYYLEDGSNLVIVASNAGEDQDPAWWRNLQAMDTAEVEVGPVRRRIRARRADAAEAAAYYERFVTADAMFAEYRRRASRDIPVIILEPA